MGRVTYDQVRFPQDHGGVLHVVFALLAGADSRDEMSAQWLIKEGASLTVDIYFAAGEFGDRERFLLHKLITDHRSNVGKNPFDTALTWRLKEVARLLNSDIPNIADGLHTILGGMVLTNALYSRDGHHTGGFHFIADIQYTRSAENVTIEFDPLFQVLLAARDDLDTLTSLLIEPPRRTEMN